MDLQAIKDLVTKSSIRVTDIMKYDRVSYSTAIKRFRKLKEKDNDPYDCYPNEIPLELYLKAKGTDLDKLKTRVDILTKIGE